MIARGLVFMGYTADDGTVFQTLVNASEALDATRGWTAVTIGADLLPRAFRERRARGISPTTGRSAVCRVGSVTCDLWTGLSNSFTVLANDQTIDTMTVVERVRERRRLAD